MSKSEEGDKIAGVAVTKCPPGSAVGAGDLQNWSQRRATGKSGVWTADPWKKERNRKRKARRKGKRR